MQKRLLVMMLAFQLAILTKGFSQNVSINTTGDPADASAMFDISSTNRGLLIPRMTQAQRNAISSPANALLIYQTDATPGFYYYSTFSSSWTLLSLGAGIGSLNGLTAVAQTFAAPGTSGTAPNWSSSVAAHTLNIPMASAGGVTAGLLSNTDWTSFNNKLSSVDTTNISNFSYKVRTRLSAGAGISYNNVSGVISNSGVTSVNGIAGAINFSTGNLTETGSSVLAITGGTGAVFGTGAALQVRQAGAAQNGFLSSTDWNTFNNKPGAANVWSTTGNTGTVLGTNFMGTTDLKSVRFRTNNSQIMLLDSAGNVAIGNAPLQSSGNTEKLLVDAGSTPANPSTSINVITGRGYLNSYLQLNIHNKSDGTLASSDIVATADNGDETTNYVDLGINSSGNESNYFGTANDAYLYNVGQNLLIGTGTANKSLVFMTGGGTQSTSERMRINGTGNIGIGTTSPSTKLHIVGANPLTLMGVGVGGATINDSLLTISNGLVSKLPVSTFGSGSVTSASVVTANGISGTVATPTTTPAITLTLGAITPASVAAAGSITGSNVLSTNATDIAGKVTGNTAITGATKTKITYDTKGLVTAGADATTTDIAEGTNQYYTNARARTAISLTTTGTSGAATYNSTTGVLNVPAYAPGTGTVTSASVVTANGVSGSVATPATTPAITLTLGAITPASVVAAGSVTGSNLSGSHSGTSSGTNTGDETTATIKTKLGAATALADGYLTAADWNTFNNKLSAANVWSTTGNSGTTAGTNYIGTSDNKDLVFKTNAIQALTINTNQSVGVGLNPTFQTAINNRELLLVDGGPTTTSTNLISAKGTMDSYLQLNIQNKSATANASSDIVATSNDGDESYGYVNLGINSSAYNVAAYNIGGFNDSYLYSVATQAAIGGNLAIGTASSNKVIKFHTGGTTAANERMRIDGTGKVGIGTTTPTTDLTLYQSAGTTNARGFRFTGNSVGGTSSGTGFHMGLGYNLAGNKQLWLGDADIVGSATGSVLRFSASNTAFPTLDAVAGDNSSRRYVALGVAGDGNSGVIFGNDGSNVTPSSQVWGNGNMAIGNGYRANAAPANGLLVQGNVGIGTTAPTEKLDVTGIVKSSAGFVTAESIRVDSDESNAGTKFPGVLFGGPTTGETITSNRSAASSLKWGLDFWTSSTLRMTIANSGNVGIGTTNTGTYRLTVAGSIGATGFTNTSDRRLKTNITDLNYGLKDVLSLRPVSYNWKKTPNTDKQVGLIAQEVSKIVPEAVTGDETKGMLGINYAQLVPVLINAIKEQQKQIDDLKKMVETLQK